MASVLPPPIRLAIVMRPAMGGMRTHLETFLSLLNREQVAPTLIGSAEFAPLAQSLNTPHTVLEIARKTSLQADIQAIRQLTKLLAGNFDIVHGHGIRGLWIGSFAAEKARIPFVATAHNLLPKTSFVQELGLSIALRHTRRLITVSEAVMQSFQKDDLDLPPIKVIPNGVSLSHNNSSTTPADLRKQLQIPEMAPTVLGVGRLEKEKGFDQLILSFGFLRSEVPHAHLVIVGAGSEDENLSDMASSDGQIHLAGHTADPTPYFQLADVVAIPSRSEGQGIVALEAMSAGKPIVAYRVGGLPETIEEGITGYLLNPSDVLEFAQSLALLLKSAPLRRSMGEAGRARVVNRYSALKMVEQIVSVYQQVLREVQEETR